MSIKMKRTFDKIWASPNVPGTFKYSVKVRTRPKRIKEFIKNNSL